MVDIVIQLMPHILATLIYGALGFHFWNTRWREGEHQCVACPMQAWERGAIAVALLIHASGLYSALFSEAGMRFSFSFALSLMMWLAVLIYWLESFMARMEGMQPMVLPLAAACAILPTLFPQVHLVAHAAATGFKLHFLAAMLAYSLLTLSALHAIFMGFTENALHKRSLKRSLNSLPPLMTMERLLFRMLLLGFILLTLTVGSGVLFSEVLFGKPLSIDHKTLFAFASWGIFATLLVGRHAWGWRGKRALRWTLAGFSLLILAYVGSRFVAEVILGRV
ncbi:cytochrome c biogenesis protein CcsA [Dechloromonas denitrificans]|uniref:cytochrome C assembly family protein n=1 Tax=Dechloromonas denitrificans TaxID=281362 RepID=UPI001CF84226|nr:cytochrome c biogenesis protein CcsA [Dechloromonas denitrificans]UCV12269.1 cytochrome c biogenesis protein CcsA [Dechloromonas denitrificans]